ncbi:hypothetical protein ICV39_08665 [Polynucleobacter sp. MWH-UH25E]|nr:hypothetical protein ICV39_08665 [Polynucleobacter sp. MWH-UH25E]
MTVNTILDTTPPTIAIASDVSALKAGDVAHLTFTLSESSSDFTSADVSYSGGTLSNFAGSGTSYTADFTPTSNSTTSASVSVASSKFSDAAGNFNNDGSDSNNTVSMTVDTVRPTIAITADKLQLSSGQIQLTFTLSEASSDFISSDVSVTSGTLSSWSKSSSTRYTAKFNPDNFNADHSGSVSVTSNKFSDAAGNFNQDGNDANNLVTIAIKKPSSSSDPIVLDLSGDGISYIESNPGVIYDFGNGAVISPWISANDGFLAYLNTDGSLNISFSTLLGETDLQGLAKVYDVNKDGVLNSEDAEFSSFGVWNDSNGDGIADAGEVKSLAEIGIASINVVSDSNASTAANGDVVIHGQTIFTKLDGTVGIVHDVSFNVTPVATPEVPVPVPEVPIVGVVLDQAPAVLG